MPTIGAIASYVCSLNIPWELILADDGSKDDTVSLCQELNLANLYVLIAAKNGGKGSAVRRGMLAARAPWCCLPMPTTRRLSKNWVNAGQDRRGLRHRHRFACRQRAGAHRSLDPPHDEQHAARRSGPSSTCRSAIPSAASSFSAAPSRSASSAPRRSWVSRLTWKSSTWRTSGATRSPSSRSPGSTHPAQGRQRQGDQAFSQGHVAHQAKRLAGRLRRQSEGRPPFGPSRRAAGAASLPDAEGGHGQMYTKHAVLEDVLKVLQNGEKLAYKMIALGARTAAATKQPLSSSVTPTSRHSTGRSNWMADGMWSSTARKPRTPSTPAIATRSAPHAGTASMPTIAICTCWPPNSLVWGEDPDAEDNSSKRAAPVCMRRSIPPGCGHVRRRCRLGCKLRRLARTAGSRQIEKRSMHVAIVTAYPPSKGSLNEYAFHFVRALRQKDEVSWVTLLVDELPDGAGYPAPAGRSTRRRCLYYGGSTTRTPPGAFCMPCAVPTRMSYCSTCSLPPSAGKRFRPVWASWRPSSWPWPASPDGAAARHHGDGGPQAGRLRPATAA